jgi:hypothetical protein
MADSHSGGDAVRVDDHVGHDAVEGEGEVLLSESHPYRSFLPVA